MSLEPEAHVKGLGWVGLDTWHPPPRLVVGLDTVDRTHTDLPGLSCWHAPAASLSSVTHRMGGTHTSLVSHDTTRPQPAYPLSHTAWAARTHLHEHAEPLCSDASAHHARPIQYETSAR